MGWGCGSDHHQRTLGGVSISHEIIRGCFVEGTISLNWIKARCRETAAFQAGAGSRFVRMINIFFFFSFPTSFLLRSQL